MFFCSVENLNDRGIEVTSKRSDESIHSIRNYLMKYMTKQFGKGEDSLIDGELLFNSMVWATGIRMWVASKGLTEVMRKPVKISDNVTWDTVELVMPGAQLTYIQRIILVVASFIIALIMVLIYIGLVLISGN